MDICSATAMLAISEYLGGGIFIYLFIYLSPVKPAGQCETSKFIKVYI